MPASFAPSKLQWPIPVLGRWDHYAGSKPSVKQNAANAPRMMSSSLLDFYSETSDLVEAVFTPNNGIQNYWHFRLQKSRWYSTPNRIAASACTQATYILIFICQESWQAQPDTTQRCKRNVYLESEQPSSFTEPKYSAKPLLSVRSMQPEEPRNPVNSEIKQHSWNQNLPTFSASYV